MPPLESESNHPISTGPGAIDGVLPGCNRAIVGGPSDRAQSARTPFWER